jgi:hypothetical protein
VPFVRSELSRSTILLVKIFNNQLLLTFAKVKVNILKNSTAYPHLASNLSPLKVAPSQYNEHNLLQAVMAVNIAPASDSLKVAAQNQQVLRQVWENIQPDSCPDSYNFHMHTIYSDGRLSPKELIEQAVAIGLKGMAITDHHTIGGYKIAESWLEYWQQHSSYDSPLPHLWTGVEITANLLNTEVHILGYAFDPEHPSIQPYIQGEAPQGDQAQAAVVIAALHQAGGLVVLAHPARYRRSAAELIPVAAQLGIDGVETYYAYNNPNPWKPSPTATEYVRQLGATYNLLNTCGTDTHGVNLLMRL